ncbi:hypothetical protein GF359_01085 [candidate division WOR-3 bacterium]|uniref:Fibronectin type-III domain-containing protein n=1 Tax=candidate division WOR-3 bacterium TaxID=2052148 RepID=A0A9D5K7N3_UNCW3|nr:hypothetical protein [candidate division WOR-3 bacterium]MBD3363788.1 hypothetical protein [candidate division WOR-3 bacterium]
MKKILLVLMVAAFLGCTQGPPPPELCFPPDGYELTYMPFSWTSVPEANEYRLQISADEGFFDNVIDEVTADTFYSVTSHYSEFEDGTIYYWRVLSGNTDGWGNPSEVRTISVRII